MDIFGPKCNLILMYHRFLMNALKIARFELHPAGFVIINRAAGGEPNWFNWLTVVADDAAVFVDFRWCSHLQLTMQP